MSNTVETLASKSGDSELCHYVYSNGCLELRLFVPDLDAEVIVRARTPIVFANVSDKPDPAHRTCYLQLVELENEVAANDHGIYVPPSNFDVLMRHVRSGVSLAYGHSRKEYATLLCVRGAQPLVVCLLRKREDAIWEQVDSGQQLTNR